MGQEWGGVVPQRQERCTWQVRSSLALGREKPQLRGSTPPCSLPGGSGRCVGGGIGFCGSLGRQKVRAPSKFPAEVTVVAERMWGQQHPRRGSLFCPFPPPWSQDSRRPSQLPFRKMLSSGRSLGDPTGHLLSAEVQSAVHPRSRLAVGDGRMDQDTFSLEVPPCITHLRHPSFCYGNSPFNVCTERSSDGDGAQSRGFEEPWVWIILVLQREGILSSKFGNITYLPLAAVQLKILTWAQNVSELLISESFFHGTPWHTLRNALLVTLGTGSVSLGSVCFLSKTRTLTPILRTSRGQWWEGAGPH